MERTKWHVIPIENITADEARKISFKIPANIKHCRGFQFSGNVAGKEANNFELGNISLFTNNRKAHPLHYTIHSEPIAEKQGKYETLKLSEDLEGNSLIQGYYLDLGTAESYPYKVRIYLECIIYG
ncbi:MAG: hypothetical protein H0W84_08850 [Bacteroidetes bacterium]|nr:hypothetical protein [Bacteroidota bacterium]